MRSYSCVRRGYTSLALVSTKADRVGHTECARRCLAVQDMRDSNNVLTIWLREELFEVDCNKCMKGILRNCIPSLPCPAIPSIPSIPDVCNYVIILLAITFEILTDCDG